MSHKNNSGNDKLGTQLIDTRFAGQENIMKYKLWIWILVHKLQIAVVEPRAGTNFHVSDHKTFNMIHYTNYRVLQITDYRVQQVLYCE